MCQIPVRYGCGHTRLTNARPCLAALHGKQCDEHLPLDVPPISVTNPCFMCTAQAQHHEAVIRASHAQDEADSIQLQADAATRKATKAHEEAGAAQRRFKRAKASAEQVAIRFEVRQDDRHRAELEERMSEPAGPVDNSSAASPTRPRQLAFADVLRAVANVENRRHDQQFAEFCERFRREKAEAKKQADQHQAQPPETTPEVKREVKTEEDLQHDHHLNHLINSMRQSRKPPSDRPAAESSGQMSAKVKAEPTTPTTDDYIEFAPQLQTLRDVMSDHSKRRPYGMG